MNLLFDSSSNVSTNIEALAKLHQSADVIQLTLISRDDDLASEWRAFYSAVQAHTFSKISIISIEIAGDISAMGPIRFGRDRFTGLEEILVTLSLSTNLTSPVEIEVDPSPPLHLVIDHDRRD